MRALFLAAIFLSGCSLIVAPSIDAGSTGGGAGGGSSTGGGAGGGLPVGGGGGGAVQGCDGGLGLSCIKVPLTTHTSATELRLAVNDQGFIALASEPANQELMVFLIGSDGGASTLDVFPTTGAVATTALGAGGTHYVAAWSTESSALATNFSCKVDDGGVATVDVPAHFNPHGPSISVAVSSGGQVTAVAAGNVQGQYAGPSLAVSGGGCPPSLVEDTTNPFVALGVQALDGPQGATITATGQGIGNDGHLLLFRPTAGAMQFSPDLGVAPLWEHSAVSGGWVLTTFTTGSNDVQLGWNRDDASTNWYAPISGLTGVDQWNVAAQDNSRFALAYTSGRRLTLQMVTISSGQAMLRTPHDVACSVDPLVVGTAATVDTVAIASLSNGVANVYLCPVPND